MLIQKLKTMPKKIFLTFDYEMFLRKSGSINNCILKPTELIIETLNKNNIKAIFFIDILHLFMLRKAEQIDDFNKLNNNILQLLKNGHQVELHIHPHWLDAVYDKESEEWDLSNDAKYCFDSLDSIEQKKTFDFAFNELNNIVKSYDSNYKITCFRAGGLCLQPFDIFKPLLKKYNIYIESSIAPGMKSTSSTHAYDYTSHKIREPYRFTTDPLNADMNGEFKEFPITTYEINLFDKFNQKLFSIWQSKSTIFGDGQAIPPTKRQISFYDKFKKTKYFYSLDGDYNEKVLLKKMKKSKMNSITFISHPKLMSHKSLETINKIARNEHFEFELYKDFRL